MLGVEGLEQQEYNDEGNHITADSLEFCMFF